MSAGSRWIPEAKRNMATGIVNAGGSFGQFTVIPLAQLFIGIAGWQPAMVILGAIGLIAVPLIWWITQGHAEHAAAQPAAAAGSLKQADRRGGEGPELPAAHGRASSPAASTSPSSPRTCRAWWRVASCRPR